MLLPTDGPDVGASTPGIVFGCPRFYPIGVEENEGDVCKMENFVRNEGRPGRAAVSLLEILLSLCIIVVVIALALKFYNGWRYRLASDRVTK